ncbi:MAG: hypothetical protein HDT21_13545 [Ruminococcus sp.]|nr:hypothetical protein [Ruminococcus sp.]
MIWSIVIIEAIVFIALFTAMVILPAIKHPEALIHDYPPEIQEEYFKTHQRIETAPLSKRTIALKSIGIIIFSAILTAGAETFWDGVVFGLILFVSVGAWDTFFLDWVLFAHLKMFRLPGTEHMDKEYAQKWFHVKGMLFPGTLFAALIGVVTGIGVMIVK